MGRRLRWSDREAWKEPGGATVQPGKATGVTVERAGDIDLGVVERARAGTTGRSGP